MADIQLSDSEVKTIISGIEANVRADGRTRVQHRPLEIELNPVPHACGSSQVTFSSGGDGEETKVLVSIMADVVELETDCENPANQKGSLEIHLDCVPTVQMLYGKLYSGGVSLRSNFAATNKGRMTFLTHATVSLSKVFGAKVSLAGSTLDNNGDVDFSGDKDGDKDGSGETGKNKDDEEDGPSSSNSNNNNKQKKIADRSCASFYKDLYLGHGFAYELHADVNVLQGGGGNVLTAASAGILTALKTLQLPRAEITVHSDGTASVEVHPKQVRVGAPIRLHEVPLLTTACLHKGFYVVDPSLAEEVAIPSVVTVGVTDLKAVTTITQTAHTGRRAFPEGSVLNSPEDLIALLGDIVEVASDVIDSIDRCIQEAKELEEAQGGALAAKKGATAVAAISK